MSDGRDMTEGGLRNVRRKRKMIMRDLICNDENVGLLCDLLWFMFEWEAENCDEADMGLAITERIYHILTKVKKDECVVYADEFLYVYVRLLSEASERVGYILEHNYEGLAKDSIVRKLKEVLGGNMSLASLDEHCKQNYGEGRRWETLLCDFPHILKRLCRAALRLPRRKLSMDLVNLFDEGGHIGNRGDGEAMEMDGMGDSDTHEKDGSKEGKSEGVGTGKSFNEKAQLRKAIALASESDRELFEIRLFDRAPIEDIEWEEERALRKDGERGHVITFQHVPKGIAKQFERFDMEAGMENVEVKKSAFVKYINRARKRERRFLGLKCGGEEGRIVREDGLDVKINEENGQLHFVAGTEDFFTRIRKKCREGRGKRMHLENDRWESRNACMEETEGAWQ